MHTCTSSFWGMQVDDLRLMLNRKWTYIDTLGIKYFIFFSLNQPLTISPCTVNNISIIILFFEKNPIGWSRETYQGLIVIDLFKTNAYSIQNDKGKLKHSKLTDSKYFWFFNKEKETIYVIRMTQKNKNNS